jgi:2-polyprenyl-3-methyl-5-hydroxy-6-metoxy-1,4-benzoquinol methylase
MNKFDDVRLDVAQLLEEQAHKLPPPNPNAKSADGLSLSSRLAIRWRRFITWQLHRMGYHQRLVHANLKLGWFQEFQSYWVHELGNRPINPHDFHFLRGIYRQRFQDVGVADDATNEQHLAAWQDPRTIYQLFSLQYTFALYPLAARRFVRYIRRGANLCEYGCGLAPIAASLCEFYPQKNISITCADIPTLPFHFARWKFRNRRFVRMLVIDPADDAPLDDNYDVIFCMQVFEHLPRPLPIARHLHDHIKPGGAFIFDYVKSEGKGLDTAGAAQDRTAVLEYILDKFKVLEGHIPLDGSHVGAVVCQKV